jgi:DNA uptake protein ComE-like DNA-binding protein
MKTQAFTSLVTITTLWVAALSTGCTQKPTTPEQTRDETAEATKKVKEESKEAAQKLEAASDQVKEQVKAVAQGVKEGWNDDKNKTRTVDINTASETELTSLRGVGKREAQKIIKARPYKTKHELVSRGIFSEDDYLKFSDQVTVK